MDEPISKLSDFPIEDDNRITALRGGDEVALGLALAQAGCSVEAAGLLRPKRKEWAGSGDGKAALDAMAWWNKHWRSFAQAMHGSRFDEAKEILGDKCLMLWDQPSLLLHLARLTRERGDLGLSAHILNRLIYLCDRGLPKTDMTIFRYAGEAMQVDVLADLGRFDEALVAYSALSPNRGNLMAHQIQGAELLARAGRDGEAMIAIADLLVTAATRKDWGKTIRQDFVEREPALDHLRKRPDWSAMVDDPKAYPR